MLSTRACRRLLDDVSAAPFDGGPATAFLIPPLIWIPVWGVIAGSVFFEDMPFASNPLAAANALLGGALGVFWAVAGLIARRRGPHERTAIARAHVTALLAAMGLAFLIHGFARSATTAVSALGMLAVLLFAGGHWRTDILAFLAGERPRALRVAVAVGGALGGLIGLAGLLVRIPFVQSAAPAVFMGFVTFVLALLAVPWIPAMLAWARMHWQAERVLPQRS
ncbi:MAG: hypothetical protein ABIQ99_07150 [Thermoflexales bacterium]